MTPSDLFRWTLNAATLIGGVAGVVYLWQTGHLAFTRQTFPFLTPLYIATFSTVGFALFWGLFVLSGALLGDAGHMAIPLVAALLLFVMIGKFTEYQPPPTPMTVAMTFITIGYWVGVFAGVIERIQ